MNLISSNEQLLRYLPNSIPEAHGEKPLFDKILPHIEAAQAWLDEYFISGDILSGCNAQAEECAKAVVAAHALKSALAALDIVLSPNGFAVVSTNSLAPASQHRTEALAKSLTAFRDNMIDALLAQIRKSELWLGSRHAAFWSSILCRNLSLVTYVNPGAADRWEALVGLRPQISSFLGHAAHNFISPELLDALAAEYLSGKISPVRSRLVAEIRCICALKIKGRDVSDALALAVQLIRSNPEEFPEWHTSETALLFNPPFFENKKNSPGYFF